MTATLKVPSVAMVAICHIRIVNEIVIRYAEDMGDLIKTDSTIYNHEVKKLWNSLIGAFYSYRDRVYLSDKRLNQMLADASDVIDDGLNGDIANFESLICEQLRMIHQKRSELLAKHQLLGILIEYALVVFKKRYEYLLKDKKITHAGEMLTPYLLSGAFKIFVKFDDAIRKATKFKLYVDLDADDELSTALTSLDEKIQVSGLMTDAMKEASLIMEREKIAKAV